MGDERRRPGVLIPCGEDHTFQEWQRTVRMEWRNEASPEKDRAAFPGSPQRSTLNAYAHLQRFLLLHGESNGSVSDNPGEERWA